MGLKLLKRGFISVDDQRPEERFRRIEMTIKNRTVYLKLKSPPRTSWVKMVNTQLSEPLLITKELDTENVSEILPEDPTKLNPRWGNIGPRKGYKKLRNELISLQQKNPSLDLLYEGSNRFGSYFTESYKNTKDRLLPEPIIKEIEGTPLYLYKGNLYYFDSFDIHTQEEQKLLIKEQYFKQVKKFKKLQKEIQLFEKLESSRLPPAREQIPEDVRFLVWRRDGGKCVKCGSNKNLEFDHMIPVSKGGSSTERNIQLLCEQCNREKSDKV